jgi:hypothetical protein
MAGTIKVDSINADSNLALKIANTAVAFIDATGLRPVAGNLNLDATATSKLYLPSANTVAIQTAGVTAVTVDSSQNVGIGTTAPQQRLGIKPATNVPQLYLIQDNVANDGYKLFADSSAGYLGFLRTSSGSDTESMRIDSSGNLLVGQTTQTGNEKFGVTQSAASSFAAYFNATAGNYGYDVVKIRCARGSATNEYNFINCLQVSTLVFQVLASGNVQNTNNSYGAISDIKLKENIVDATPKLADLMQVKVRNYNLKSDPTHKQIGVIAQELEQVFPAMVEEATDKDEEGNSLGTTTKGVKYSVFVPMLVKAIQELKALNDTQAETITALTARIVALETI